MFVVYWYVGFAMWNMVRKKLFIQEEIYTEGMVRYYPYITIVTLFIGIGSLYFSALSYAGAPYSFKCWLIPTLILAILEGIRRHNTLKKIASNK